MNKEQIEQLDKISNELFKTDYKYIGLDVCKVQVLEKYLEVSELLYTEEQVRQVYRIAASDTHKALLPELEDEAINYIQSLKQD